MLTVVVFAAGSFIIVALANSIPLVLFGVVCASISAGFGEITYLAFTARYDKLVIIISILIILIGLLLLDGPEEQV